MIKYLNKIIKISTLYRLIFICLLLNICQGQNYLSYLSATSGDPLFTTYAAPLDRSEFIVDEGYHFRFYQPEEGIDFITDAADYLSIAFKLNNEVRYRLNQMYSAPIITTSYCDLVKYKFEPFQDIEVSSFFQVFSSRIAIQDITIKNNRTQSMQLDFYPFLQHPVEISEVNISNDIQSFSFSHEELPDGWTLGHSVPYQDVLANIYLLSETPDAFGSYSELGSIPEPLSPPPLPLNNYCVEWGLVYHADGSLCYHTPPDAQQIILHNGSPEEILTESAPKWGDPDPNIPGNGYQGCELGNFRNPPIATGDSFTVIFTCLASGEQGTTSGAIPALPSPQGVNTTLSLTQNPFPPTPQNVNIHFSQTYNSAVLSWDQIPGLIYSVYRRTESSPGRYDLLVDSLNSAGYMDLGLNPDSTYGYVIVARDGQGSFSAHSSEVGNIGLRSFFADVFRPLLSNVLSPIQTKVIAFQKTVSLEAGESKRFRIIRGVVEENGNLDSLRLACENLLAYNMDQAVAEDELLYAQIPRFTITNPDYEMMYWSAFSMMRQCMLPPEGQCSYNYNVYSREPTWGWGHAGQVFHENLSMLAYAFMDPTSAQQSQWVFAERMSSQPGWPAGYIPYRVGPYLNEVNFWAGEYSSSAPWFSWENWEIFSVSGDTTFLEQMYDYGQQFYDFWITNRDDDQDGLCEWGGHSFWESVRDFNVIWYILGGWADPHNANKVEALDLNCELVMEAKALANMADALGKPQEAQEWRDMAEIRADSINNLMWDPITHFYYHVEKQTNSFTYQTSNDLKHKEHIGFLPMWAGICNIDQVNYLVQELHDPNTFGRPYGEPLQAYSDPLDPGNGYFTHSVYPEWVFLNFKGLLRYGLTQEAEFVAQRLFNGIDQTLKNNHDFYESYYCNEPRPSDSWLHTYIWTGVVARMIIDLYGPAVRIEEKLVSTLPRNFELRQNFPNPFNPSTEIEFILPRNQQVKLTVYDILGRRIKNLVNGKLGAGQHKVTWNGTDDLNHPVASGIYFYEIRTPEFNKVNKMILIQ